MESSHHVCVFQFVMQRHADVMYMLVSDSKLRSNRNLTEINIYGFGGRSQKLRIDIQMKRVVLRRIAKPPMHSQTGWHDRDRSRFKRLLKALITEARRYINGRSQLNYDAVVLQRRHGPFRY